MFVQPIPQRPAVQGMQQPQLQQPAVSPFGPFGPFPQIQPFPQFGLFPQYPQYPQFGLLPSFQQLPQFPQFGPYQQMQPPIQVIYMQSTPTTSEVPVVQSPKITLSRPMPEIDTTKPVEVKIDKLPDKLPEVKIDEIKEQPVQISSYGPIRRTGTDKHTIEECNELATQLEMTCLDKTYISSHVPLNWVCKYGHTFKSRYVNLRKTKICPHCRMDVHKQECDKLAKLYGGECILVGAKANMQCIWRCKEKHVFSASKRTIQAGEWCIKCINGTKFQEVASIISEKKGKLLSEDVEFVEGSRSRISCVNNHEFLLSLDDVIRGIWCPVCKSK